MTSVAEIMKNKEVDFYNRDEKLEMRLAEEEKLKEIYNWENLSEPLKTQVCALIEHLAFDRVSIKNSQMVLEFNGTVVAYNNGGGQKGIRENPNLTACLKLKKDFRETLAKLTEITNIDLLKEDDEFIKFINSKD